MKFLNEAETRQILKSLEKYHVVFAKIFELGYIAFDESIPTACLRFNEFGKPLEYAFNPHFWQSIDMPTKLFVIKHETAHAFLRHGERGRYLLQSGADRGNINAAMDVAVNHLLVDSFGVVREEIQDADQYCWIDTVFKDKQVSDKLSFESYYDMLVQQQQQEQEEQEETPESGDGEGEDDKSQGGNEPDKDKPEGDSSAPSEGSEEGEGEGSNSPANNDSEGNEDDSEADANGSPNGSSQDSSMGGNSKPKSVDQHDFLDENGAKTIEEVIRRVQNAVSQEELEDFNDIIRNAGSAAGGDLFRIEAPKMKPNMRWLNMVKRFAMKTEAPDYKIKPQFVFENKRMRMIPKDYLMPQEYAVYEENSTKKKTEVWLFVDVSESCRVLKQYFLLAAKTFPEKHFKLRTFIFDTRVTAFDIKNPVFRSGGGTSYSIIENFITKTCRDERIEYPSMVIVMTDGEGDKVNPLHPQRWNWVLSNLKQHKESVYNRCIPENCRLHDLKDYFDMEGNKKHVQKMNNGGGY